MNLLYLLAVHTIVVEMNTYPSERDFKNANGDNGSFQKKFKIYGRKGDVCSRNNCKGKIIKFFQTNRSTYMCQICQK